MQPTVHEVQYLQQNDYWVNGIFSLANKSNFVHQEQHPTSFSLANAVHSNSKNTLSHLVHPQQLSLCNEHPYGEERNSNSLLLSHSGTATTEEPTYANLTVVNELSHTCTQINEPETDTTTYRNESCAQKPLEETAEQLQNNHLFQDGLTIVYDTSSQFTEVQSVPSSTELDIAAKGKNKSFPADQGNIGNVMMPINFSSDTVTNNIISEKSNVYVSVASSSNTNKSKRIWDKKYPCCFCKLMFAKLPRHFERVHVNEPEVQQFLVLDKASKSRKEKIDELRNRALFQHNCEVLKTGKGTIVPKKRPPCPTNPEKYLPCESCSGFYSRKQLIRHFKRCVKRNGENMSNIRNRGVQTRGALLLPTKIITTENFRTDILSKMNEDDVCHAITKDELILQFGQHTYEKLCHEKRHHKLVSCRLREMGRFLIAAKEGDGSITELKDLIKPSNYKIVKEAVRRVAGFDEEKNTFLVPSLALKLGMSIKKCAMVLKGVCMEDDNLRTKIPEIDAFIQLFELKWTGDVTRKAHRTLYEHKWNKPKRIPLANDITLLNKFLLKKDKELCLLLLNSPTPKIFEELAEVTLCRTLVLNRRRVGEIQYMKLRDFLNAPQSDTSSEIYESLSEAERILVRSLKRVEIKGKKGRKVPVILTSDLQASISLLNEKRKDFEMNNTNEYLFPSVSQSCGHFRADILLKKFAHSCGAKHPENLTSTQLRKHVATLSQLLNLRDHELDALAKYMGHDIRVHREYYRLAEDTMDLAKIGKLLINMEKGNIMTMKNKNLDEINIDEELSELEDNFDDDDDDDPNEDDPQHNVALQVPRGREIEKCQWKENGFEQNSTSKRRPRVKRRQWSQEDLNAVRSYFKGYIHLRKIPGKKDVEKFLETNSRVMKDRSWKDVKYCVYNSFAKSKPCGK